MALDEADRRPGTSRAFLTDFGLAKSVVTGSKVTRTGQALGTPATMSPEQARGEVSSLTPATDVWSLGCVLYEVLAGRPPFEGDTPAAVIARVLLQEAPALAGRARGIPATLEPLIRACLAKEARRRPADASALRDDLDRILRGARPLARPPRSRGPIAAGALLLGAGATLATLALAGWGRETPPAAATPSGPEALASRAWALRLADVRRARGLLREALSQAPDRHDWRLQAGLLEWAVREDEAAGRLWSEVPAGAPQRIRALWLRGLLALAHDLEAPSDQRLEEARVVWAEASRGAEAEARWARGGILVLQGRVAEARAILDPEASWESGLLLAILEAAAHAKGWGWRPETAVRCCTRAIAEGIPMAWVFACRGDVHRLREDFGAALADYDAALAIAPGFRQALTNRGAVRYRTGDLHGAITDFDATLAVMPSNAGVLVNRGMARRDQGDLTRALSDLDAAIALDPRNLDAYLARAITRDRQGDASGTIADYDVILARDPAHKAARCNRGALRTRGGDLAGALSDYDAALAVDPRMPEALVNRGLARRTLGDLAGARADFDAVLAMDPQHTGAWVNRGILRAGQGDHAGAAADIEQALRFAPPGWPHRERFERRLRELRAGS